MHKELLIICQTYPNALLPLTQTCSNSGQDIGDPTCFSVMVIAGLFHQHQCYTPAGPGEWWQCSLSGPGLWGNGEYIWVCQLLCYVEKCGRVIWKLASSAGPLLLQHIHTLLELQLLLHSLQRLSVWMCKSRREPVDEAMREYTCTQLPKLLLVHKSVNRLWNH